MVFIPVVPTQRPPSGRALDLGRRLKAEVEKFEEQYPGTSREDLRAAAGIAIGEAPARTRVSRQVRAAVAGLIGIIAALGMMLEAANSAVGGGDKGGLVATGIALACVGAIVVVLLLKRARG